MFRTIFVSFFFFLFSLCCISQSFNGYYDSTSELHGPELKDALYHIIDNHTTYSYTATSTDVWNILSLSDRDPNDTTKVILVYTGESIDASAEYNSGKGWSREHVWAKSHGDFGTSRGAGTDAHHLKPADISVNSARNNKDFDIGGDQYFDAGGTIPTSCFSTPYTWEPRDEVKGDIARMIFYMATRYNGENGDPDLSIVEYVNSIDFCDDANNIGVIGRLSTLLAWHASDPVDSFEIRRNEIIFSFQNNRNPFIDHPEFVFDIWGDSPTDIKKNQLSENVEMLVFDHSLTVNVASNNPSYLSIISSTGQIVFRSQIQSDCIVNDLKTGVYIANVVSCDVSFVEKFIIK